MARLDDTRQTFDYDKLLTHATGWDGCIYCLAPETAYLAGLNLERFTSWRRRWHHTDGSPLSDEEWDNAQAIVAQGVYELMGGCDALGSEIRAGLETLAAAISSSGGGGGSGNCFPQNAVIQCIINLPNEELLPPGDSGHGDPLVDPPPDGFATWQEYFAYKCQAANFIWWLERKHMVNLRNFEGIAALASILGPSIAGLAGLLPAAFTPAGFAVFVAAVVSIGLLSLTSWFFMDEMIQWWDDNQELIVCALYDSGTSVEATAALGNLLEDAIQAIVTWGALSPVAGAIADLLGTAFSQLAGNGIVAPLFAAAASVVSIENAIVCATACQEEQTGDIAQTAQSSPHNVLVVGDAIYSYSNSSTGYMGQNSGQHVDLEFSLDLPITGLWQWSAQFSPDETNETNTAVVLLQVGGGQNWANVDGGTWTFPNLSGTTWNNIGATDVDINLDANQTYRFHMAPQDFNQFGWYRRFWARTQT